MSEPLHASAASADAIKDTGQKEDSYKPNPPETAPPPKRPRFDKQSGKRRGGTSFTKFEPIISLSIVQRKRTFPVFTSNNGCKTLAHLCYRAIQGRDFRLANAISELQLAYVLTIAFCNRVVQTATFCGYAFPLAASRLKQIASGIQLPSVLAQYIESIGQFQMASAAVITPYAANYRELFPPGSSLMLDPAVVLAEAGRNVPPGDWALDTDWIIDYNDATTRASRSGMRFRTVDNNDFKGRAELLTSFINSDEMLLPKAPQVMSEAEAQLGASYRFRDYNQRDDWFGENKELLFDAFTAIPFDPQIVFSDICVAAFRGAQISME